jgi:nucleolar protein 56
VCFAFLACACCGLINAILDVPTSKFGDALRAQVEERLNFFETGAPPSKNADAIRRVLDDLAMENDDEDVDEEMAEPILTTLEPTPKKEKKKKRKSEAMEVDGDEDDEAHPVKKVKLSKEDKKALKRAKKEKKEAMKAAAGTDVRV